MLEVLDTAGQEDYTALRDQWVRDGEGFVLVYSITSRSSFTRIQRFYQHVQRIKGHTASSPTGMAFTGGYQLPSSPSSKFSPATAQVPIMLVGNKSDRVTEREVSMQEGQALARSLGCEFVEASAKNCINVEKAFYDVVRMLRSQRQQSIQRPLEIRSPTIPATSSGDIGRAASTTSRPNNSRISRHKPFKCAIL